MSTPPELNLSQLEAVNYVNGPSLVIAGAGSGKTRVITQKIAKLIQSGIAPERVNADYAAPALQAPRGGVRLVLRIDDAHDRLTDR